VEYDGVNQQSSAASTTPQDDPDATLQDLAATFDEGSVTAPPGQQGTSAASNHQLEQGLQQLQAEIQHLRQDFETKLMYDESKERQITSLHQELQGHREGLHFRLLRPLLMDLIAMYDDLVRWVNDLPSGGDAPDTTRMAKNLLSFQDSIIETLQRQNVEPYNAPEETYVAGRQRVVKAIDTTDPQLDKKIARRVRQGFEYEGKVIRPEWVEAYKYTPAE
jgi:molecular chaperone GrpE